MVSLQEKSSCRNLAWRRRVELTAAAGRLGVGMSRVESSAEELVALLRGGAAERESAIAELFRLEAEHNAGSSGGAERLAEIAVACASPLCEVLSRPVSEVDAEAYIAI